METNNMRKIFLLAIFLVFFNLNVFAVEDSSAEESCIKFAYICEGPPLNLIVGENCWSSELSAEAKAAATEWEKSEVGADCEPLDADNDEVPDSETVPCENCAEDKKMGCCYDYFADGTPKFLSFTTQAGCEGQFWDAKCAGGVGPQAITGCCVCKAESFGCIDKGGKRDYFYSTQGQASYEACLASCTSSLNGELIAFDTEDPTCAKSRGIYGICGDCQVDIALGEQCDPPTSRCDFGVPCNAACKCAATADWCKKHSVCKENGQICDFDSVKCAIIETSCKPCARGTVCKQSKDTQGWIVAQCVAPDTRGATGTGAKPLGWASAPLEIINTVGIETMAAGAAFVVAVIVGVLFLKMRKKK